MDALTEEVLGRCQALIEESETDAEEHELSKRLAEHCLVVEATSRGWEEALQKSELEDEQKAVLAEAAASRCMKRDDPALRTVKMQVAIDEVSHIVDERLQALVQDQESKNTRKVADIVKIGKLRGDAQITQLYKEIFNLMVDNEPNGEVDRRVEREIAAALQSAFPRADIPAYSKAATQVKRVQISRLIDIVLGVRLYNWSIGKGGVGIENIPQILQKEIELLFSDVQPELEGARRQQRELAAVLALEVNKPGSISSPVGVLRAESGAIDQYIRYFVELQQDILESRDLVRDSAAQIDAEFNAVTGLIGARQSVPKGQVFPKFAVIAALWRALLLEREANNGRIAVFETLQRFQTCITLNEADLEAAKEAGLMEPAGIEAETMSPESTQRVLPKVITMDEPTSREMGTDMPTHIVETHIDPQYCWNEWEMRRRALQMVRLTNCRTHSTQTHLSHFRRDAETQDWVKQPMANGVMPGMGTQTRRDQGTSVPKPTRYYQNLRGRPGAKFAIAEVNLPIDKEQHNCIADEIAYETNGRVGARESHRVSVEFADGKVKEFQSGDKHVSSK